MVDVEKAIEILSSYTNNYFGDKLHGGQVGVVDIIELLKEQEQTINELEERLRLLKYGDQNTLQSIMIPAT